MNNFKQTDIGLIPEDWDVDVIDNHFEVKQGKQISQRTRQGNNQKRFLRTANVFWGKLDLDELDEMHFTREEEEKLQLRFNDLLVCEGGDIGRTALWRSELKDCYYQNHIHRLRLKQGSVDPNFFMNWMYYGVVLSNKYFGIGNRTTIPNLSGSRLKAFQFPLPSLPEQKKIALVLSKIQQAIEIQEQIIKTTQELKKALMQKLFTEGLNGEPQKQTEIGPIPESWEVVEIGYLFDVKQGKQLSARNRQGDNQKPFLRTSNIFWNRLDLNNLDEMNFLPNEETILRLKIDDILLCEGGDIGRCLVLDRELSGIYYQNHLHRLRRKVNNINPYFFTYWMNYALELSDKYGGIGNRTTIPNLSSSKLKSMVIPFPEIIEQNEIANKFIFLDRKIEFSEIEKEILVDLFKSSLNKLMTGQIRVNNIEFKLEETQLSLLACPSEMK